MEPVAGSCASSMGLESRCDGAARTRSRGRGAACRTLQESAAPRLEHHRPRSRLRAVRNHAGQALPWSEWDLLVPPIGSTFVLWSRPEGLIGLRRVCGAGGPGQSNSGSLRLPLLGLLATPPHHSARQSAFCAAVRPDTTSAVHDGCLLSK